LVIIIIITFSSKITCNIIYLFISNDLE